MAGGSRVNKRRSATGASSSRSVEEDLNDGSMRRSWKPPRTEEEWALFGRTQADWALTEEEHTLWEEAWDEYVHTHNWEEPVTWGDRTVSQMGDPPASQVMPHKLKQSCDQANAEILTLKEKWLQNRERQLQKEARIRQRKEELKAMKAEIACLEQEISEEGHLVREIKESYAGLENSINEKAEWIIRCQNIYPH